jgi:hypothetical protein
VVAEKLPKHLKEAEFNGEDEQADQDLFTKDLQAYTFQYVDSALYNVDSPYVDMPTASVYSRLG